MIIEMIKVKIARQIGGKWVDVYNLTFQVNEKGAEHNQIYKMSFILISQKYDQTRDVRIESFKHLKSSKLSCLCTIMLLHPALPTHAHTHALSICISIFLYVSLFLSPSFYSISLSVCLSVCLSVSLSVSLSLSVYRFGFWGSAPDPAGKAYNTPQSPQS